MSTSEAQNALRTARGALSAPEARGTRAPQARLTHVEAVWEA
jgi:hypothetical protein